MWEGEGPRYNPSKREPMLTIQIFPIYTYTHFKGPGDDGVGFQLPPYPHTEQAMGELLGDAAAIHQVGTEMYMCVYKVVIYIHKHTFMIQKPQTLYTPARLSPPSISTSTGGGTLAPPAGAGPDEPRVRLCGHASASASRGAAGGPVQTAAADGRSHPHGLVRRVLQGRDVPRDAVGARGRGGWGGFEGGAVGGDYGGESEHGLAACRGPLDAGGAGVVAVDGCVSCGLLCYSCGGGLGCWRWLCVCALVRHWSAFHTRVTCRPIH